MPELLLSLVGMPRVDKRYDDREEPGGGAEEERLGSIK